MENKENTNYTCGHCACGACGVGGGMMGMHGKHSMRHKLFWILILIIVFCLGSAWGELKGEVHSLRNHGGYGMMGHQFMVGDKDFNFQYKLQTPTPIAPATPATPAQ